MIECRGPLAIDCSPSFPPSVRRRVSRNCISRKSASVLRSRRRQWARRGDSHSFAGIALPWRERACACDERCADMTTFFLRRGLGCYSSLGDMIADLAKGGSRLGEQLGHQRLDVAYFSAAKAPSTRPRTFRPPTAVHSSGRPQ